MYLYCLLVLVVVSVLDAAPAAPEVNCTNVDCSSYKFDVVSHTEKFQECRFKIRQDVNDKFKSGLQIHSYADLTMEKSGFYEQTQDCPAGGMLRMTESPRHKDLASLFRDADYRTCCAQNVVDTCYYKVVTYMNCNQWSPDSPTTNDRLDDTVDRVEVMYRNKKKNKRVTAIFDPKTGELRCENDFNDKTAVVSKAATGTKRCGDSDINVKIRSFSGRGTDGTRILKVLRWQCNAQYAAMFTSPSKREKFTMRTVVDPKYKNVNKYVGRGKGKTQVAPVLAKTFSGACGTIASSVNLLP